VCDSCNFSFEERQSFHDEPEAVCPRCEGMARRVFYPAPIIFKGSGFYVTDSRGKTGASDEIKSDEGEKTPAGKPPEKSSDKGESKDG